MRTHNPTFLSAFVVLCLIVTSLVVGVGAVEGSVSSGWHPISGVQNHNYYYYSTSTNTVCTSNCLLNVNLLYVETGTIDVLIQVCKDAYCHLVVQDETVTLTNEGWTARTYILTAPPNKFYVRISGLHIFTQSRQVIFGASPQTVIFVIV